MFVYIAFVNYLISLYCFNSGGSFICFIIEIPVLTLGASEPMNPGTYGYYRGKFWVRLGAREPCPPVHKDVVTPRHLF